MENPRKKKTSDEAFYRKLPEEMIFRYEGG